MVGPVSSEPQALDRLMVNSIGSKNNRSAAHDMVGGIVTLLPFVPQCIAGATAALLAARPFTETENLRSLTLSDAGYTVSGFPFTGVAFCQILRHQ